MTLRLDLLVTGHPCGLKNSDKYFTLIQPKHAYSGIPICTPNLIIASLGFHLQKLFGYVVPTNFHT